MKVIITGSLGHIGKPLTEELTEKNHEVVVISSKEDKRAEIEGLGATAAIGSIEDSQFLTSAFSGADVVYCMVPPNFGEANLIAYYTRVAENYVDAIKQAGVKRAILLSSYGAHLNAGTGFILGAHHAENIFKKLNGVNVTVMRPGYFYYNLNNFISTIKAAGFIASNYGGDDKLILVSPKDIAAAIADEIINPSGNKIVYVASDDKTCNEIASVLGKAINMPEMEWKTISNEQTLNAMTGNGIPKHVAENFVELGAAAHSGILREDYDKHQPVKGKVSIEEYAKEFAKAYSSANTNSH